MRKTIFILLCCIGLLLLGYTGFRGFQVWKQSHGLSMARKYYAKADVPNTILALRQVLNTNPRNIEACRMMAVLAEAERRREALIWRARALEANPKSLEDRLSLAQTAIVFQDYPLATNTLAGVVDTDRNLAVYQNIAGAAALLGGAYDDAETHFSEAIRLDPSNPTPQVNLAVVRLHRTNVLDLAEARISLQRVTENSTNAILRSEARRELVHDAMRFNNMPTALEFSKELAEQSNSVFDDKVLRLDVLMKVKSDEFKPTLALFEREAATNSSKLFYLASWQADKLSPAKALEWLQSLPMQTRTNQPAALLIADCQMQSGNWRELQASIQLQDWKDFEYMRHAYLARSLREQSLKEASVAEWTAALNSANNMKIAASDQKRILNGLLDLAAKWKWNTEAEQLLWIVVKNYPEEKNAPHVLEGALFTWGRTRSLLELYTILNKRTPDDSEIKNNLAMMAMLLREQEIKPFDLAQNVYDSANTNPSYISTYAFSLYLQKKYPEALKVIQQLTPKELEKPSTACYYGLILKANGKNAEAAGFLNESSKAFLLPEERTLFYQAKMEL